MPWPEPAPDRHSAILANAKALQTNRLSPTNSWRRFTLQSKRRTVIAVTVHASKRSVKSAAYHKAAPRADVDSKSVPQIPALGLASAKLQLEPFCDSVPFRVRSFHGPSGVVRAAGSQLLSCVQITNRIGSRVRGTKADSTVGNLNRLHLALSDGDRTAKTEARIR